MYNEPLVAVVIVHWGSPNMTMECLKKVLSEQYENLHLIVVDNCPEQRLWKCPEEIDNKITYICNESNKGYCGGNNVGIMKAQLFGAKYIFLLNNDAIIDKNLLNICVAHMESHSDISVISPKLLYYHAPEYIDKAGGDLDNNGCNHNNFGCDEKDVGQYEFEREITFANGCAFFARTSVFEQIGLFDENLFCYGEDIDISRRIVYSGMKMSYFPNAKVWHKHLSLKVGEKVNLPSRFIIYYSWRNHFYLLRQYISGKFVLDYIKFGYQFIWSLAALTLKHKRPDLSLAMILGLSDSIANRMGKRDYSFFNK